MKITKLQRDLYQFASKSEIRPVLAAVRMNGKVAVATDSFRLVEVTNTSEEAKAEAPILITAKSLRAVKMKESTGAEIVAEGDKMFIRDTLHAFDVQLVEKSTATPDEYPDYAAIWPTGEHQEVTISGQYLGEVLLLLSKLGKHQEVVLRVYRDAHKPVEIIAKGNGQEARAMVMQIRK
ncbi:MAG: hypothetical protein Q7S52_05425 [bacterium]|nr:hypothetical protein [bacterium]